MLREQWEMRREVEVTIGKVHFYIPLNASLNNYLYTNNCVKWKL